jgi:hypothetical protein
MNDGYCACFGALWRVKLESWFELLYFGTLPLRQADR